MAGLRKGAGPNFAYPCQTSLRVSTPHARRGAPPIYPTLVNRATRGGLDAGLLSPVLVTPVLACLTTVPVTVGVRVLSIRLVLGAVLRLPRRR